MQMVAGLGSLNLPSLFTSAERRIILHAAVYGPFAESVPHRDGLEAALEKDSFLSLDIIALQSESAWTPSFMKALRFGATVEHHSKTLNASTHFLHTLKTRHPKKIHIHPQPTIPCLPIIIIDDTVIFGQYAHSESRAANGFWGTINTDVDKLFGWAMDNRVPTEASKEEIAAYRLISECHHAMSGGAK